MSGLNSALFTGLSGLSVNQQQLSVISNNIANSNTTAFKTSRVIFTTEAYITSDPGSPASSNLRRLQPQPDRLRRSRRRDRNRFHARTDSSHRSGHGHGHQWQWFFRR